MHTSTKLRVLTISDRDVPSKLMRDKGGNFYIEEETRLDILVTITVVHC
jgi:hypothetical protein